MTTTCAIGRDAAQQYWADGLTSVRQDIVTACNSS